MGTNIRVQFEHLQNGKRATNASFGLACIFICGCLFLGLGCGDDGLGPIVPERPINSFPANRSSDIPTILELNWSYVDTTSDSLFFDLYLGTSKSPPLYAARLIDTLYAPERLEFGTTYYWKLVAYNDVGDSISSPVWRFKTNTTFIFPIAIGNRWEYTEKAWASDFDSASAPYFWFDGDTMFVSSVTDVVGLDTMPSRSPRYIFHTAWQSEYGGGELDEYRTNTSAGMYLLGSFGSSWVGPPKIRSSEEVCYEFKGVKTTTLAELLNVFRLGTSKANISGDIVADDFPVLELAYPLDIGLRWAYRSVDSGAVWNMDKMVVGRESIDVPAGTFDCFKIQWFWDIDGDGVWDTDIIGYDYVSNIGTVRRQFLFFDVAITSPAGDTVLTVDIVNDYQLTAFEIH